MKSVLVLVALFCAVNALSFVPGTHPQFEKFASFMKTYNKQYSSREEFETRFKIFVDNVQRIDQLNAQATTAKYNVTQFSDMTVEEFRSYPCGVDKLSELTPKRPGFKPNYADLKADLAAVAAPSSWDWTTNGAVTPVKDQGQCVSCWAFSTIGNIESQYAIKNPPSNGQVLQFAEQELVDCSQGCSDEYQYGPVCNQGCDGGWQWNAFFDVLSWKGVMRETDYPYTAEDGSCARDQTKTLSPIKNYTCLSQYNVTGGDSEDQMAAYLVQNGPISVALNADLLMSYDSGIINPSSDDDCDPTELDHALLIVGYDVDSTTNTPYWIIKNSWADSWGEQGYFRIVRGKGACGLNNAVSSANM